MARQPGTARAVVTAADAAKPQTGRTVRAFQRGFYGNNLIEIGVTFTLTREDFAPQWMEFADGEPDVLAERVRAGGSKDARTRKNAMKTVDSRTALQSPAPGDGALGQDFDDDKA